jgi:hypothetical protein
VVAFWISSPTFLGGRPSGPHFGARAAALVTSPPTTFMYTEKIDFRINMFKAIFQFYHSGIFKKQLVHLLNLTSSGAPGSGFGPMI